MHSNRTLSLLAAALAALVFAAPAGARTRHHSCVVPRLSGVTLKVARERLARAHCRMGTVHRPNAASGNLRVSSQRPRAGRRIRRGSEVSVWLKAKPVSLPAPKVSYSTSVDPSFVQAPTNPLAVTYTYSASATSTVNGVVTNLATTGTVPAGILNFYNGSALVCSMNVGGSTAQGPCTVTYPATGTYQVTTQYIPTGATAVTETDSETIRPAATASALSCSPFAGPASQTDEDCTLDVTSSGVSVPVSNGDVTWTILDTTTARTLFSSVVYDIGAVAAFGLVPSCTNPNPNGTCTVDNAYYIAFSSGGPVQETGLFTSASDALTIQASYTPAASIPYVGSASSTIPFVLTTP